MKNVILSTIVCLVFVGTAAAQSIVLRDEFNDSSIAVNNGPAAVGHGFVLNDLWTSPAPPWSATYSVANGAATISGPMTVKTLVSIDSFDPTNSIVTWKIARRPSTDANGVIVGWTVPRVGNGCCGPGITLEARADRVVFDLSSAPTPWNRSDVQISRYVDLRLGSTAEDSVYTNNSSALTASIHLTAKWWKIDVTGDGVDIHRMGPYENCTIIFSKGQPCATPADVTSTTAGS